MNHSDYQALDDDEVAVCPECDDSGVVMNTTNAHKSHPETLDRYRCVDCNATFETFARRARQRDLGPTRGMAKDLAEADPDEVSR